MNEECFIKMFVFEKGFKQIHSFDQGHFLSELEKLLRLCHSYTLSLSNWNTLIGNTSIKAKIGPFKIPFDNMRK